jgi:beta-glucanase (GH16 family)
MKRIILFLPFYLLTVGLITAADEQLIGVSSPAYCSDIEGNTTIHILAPTYTSLNVYCWKQGDGYGSNSLVGTVDLDTDGVGSIVFPANEYPHGPVTLRISGTNSVSYTDNCYLQLYNKGGVLWNEGLPADPPAAAGMNLVFVDDFDDPNLSIGPGPNTTYYDHKPDHTDFSSPLLFTSFSNAQKNPFSQVDTYLRIRGDQNKLSTGLISSVKNDGSGFSTKLPSYFECRFIAPNAPGSWPAFWLLSVKDYPENKACDELDIIEAYGGEGPKRPNSGDAYQIAAHPWGRTDDLTNPETIEGKRVYAGNPIRTSKFGIPSSWYETPHIYGCKVESDSVTYYCDNIQVQKHATFMYAKVQPMFFLINLATGGGWPTDLSRYNGTIDMYVDYVRVYSGGTPTAVLSPETSDFEVNVSPNPVNSEAVISLYSPGIENISITLHNAQGQQVFSNQTRQQGTVRVPVDMSNLNTGVYLAQVTVGNLQANKTILKR